MTHPHDPSLPDLEQQDIELAEAAGRQRHRPLVRWAGWMSELADQPQLAALCASTALVGLAGGRRDILATGLQMLLAHAIATQAKGWIKNRVRRVRPYVVLDEGRYERETGETRHPRERSFPSGHTAGAVAVATVVALRHPAMAVPALALAAAASLVQLPRAKHYPSDLAAGTAIGLAGAGLSLGVGALLAGALRRR
ncbi:phosphatase PAP2 family protein [Aureimonas jatrophae]|uniref:Undecaprenyl-diphosphatase n=1 Tax=Aureimonas jatrophae TaxID=1166073 RepID=A0A1H0CIL1_9HYPH|nr:phosphatase PAP2 family protein [Aureimonas jatrophae]MBB3949246.1 undecaprenyl-diphosphatase [Aureimonas jatrophae]SDN57631.1 undecaprenyl-diphosphatase [Aureimonas jatrophae]